MSKITFNSANVRAVATKIRTNVGTIEDDLSKIDNLCNTIETSWKGQDSTTYINKVIQKRKEISMLTECLRGLADTLDKYATSMDNTQTSIATEGSKM